MDLKLLMRLLKETVPYAALFWTCLGLAVLLAPINSMRPFLVGKMVDDHILIGDLPGLKTIAIIYVVLTLVNVVMRYAFIYLTALVGQNVIRDLRTRIFKKMTSLPLSYFELPRRGQSMISRRLTPSLHKE